MFDDIGELTEVCKINVLDQNCDYCSSQFVKFTVTPLKLNVYYIVWIIIYVSNNFLKDNSFKRCMEMG